MASNTLKVIFLQAVQQFIQQKDKNDREINPTRKFLSDSSGFVRKVQEKKEFRWIQCPWGP